MPRKREMVVDVSDTRKSIAETLTHELLVNKYRFNPQPVRLRVNRGRGEDGDLYLWPDGLDQGDRLRDILGLEDGERKPIYCPAAYTLVEGDTGTWLVRPGPRIITAVPFPEKLREMEADGLVNTEPVALPDGFRFKRSGDSWTAKDAGGKGPLMVPLRGFDPGFDPADPDQSLAHNNLSRRPGLTACIWIVGPKTQIEGASTDDLSKPVMYDEAAAHELPKFSFAKMFMVLGAWRTAFEIFGAPDMERLWGVKYTPSGTYSGFQADIDGFRADMVDRLANGDRWLNRTLCALLHTDVQGTAHESVMARLLDKDSAINKPMRQSIIDEVKANLSLEAIKQVFEDSMREGGFALDWLKEWANWAMTEMAARQKQGLKLLIPQIAGGHQPQAGPPLIDYDSAAVAAALLDHIRAEATRNSAKSEPLKPPTAPAAVTAITDPNRIRRLFPMPPAKNTAAPQPAKASGPAKPPTVAAAPSLKPPTAPPAAKTRTVTPPPTASGVAIADMLPAGKMAELAARVNGGNGKHTADEAAETTEPPPEVADKAKRASRRAQAKERDKKPEEKGKDIESVAPKQRGRRRATQTTE